MTVAHDDMTIGSAYDSLHDASISFEDPWDMRSSGISFDDMPLENAERALRAGIAAKRIPRRMECVHDMLCQLGLVRGGFLTNAAALLFCRSAAPLIVCRLYDGASHGILLDEQACFGPLASAHRAACDFSRRMRPFVFAANGDRGDMAAICSEVVLNALAHRDWSRFAPVSLVAYPEYVAVSNPGTIANEALEDGAPSLPDRYVSLALDGSFRVRNALLAQALYRFDVFEGQGAGLAWARAECEAQGYALSCRNAEGAAVVSIAPYRQRASAAYRACEQGRDPRIRSYRA